MFYDKQKKKLTDEELLEKVRLAKHGDVDAFESVLSFFHPAFSALSLEFFILGSEREDVYQECAIKLINVINTYNEKKGPFIPFCNLAVRSHLKTQISKELAKKRLILNNSFSWAECSHGKITENKFLYQESFLFDLISKDLQKELFNYLLTILSGKEFKVFVLKNYFDMTYREIAKEINSNEKTVDNAVNRIANKMKNKKDKIRSIFNEDEVFIPSPIFRENRCEFEEDVDGVGDWGRMVRMLEDNVA